MKALRINKRVVPGKCTTRGCKNKCKGKVKHCTTCRSRIARLKDPVRYAYNNLKNRAGQRGIEFSLTIEQFREFCIKSQYIAGKGRTMESYTIDRIDNNHGYHIWNIQVMTKGDNIKKYYLKYDWENKVAVVYSPPTTAHAERLMPEAA